MTVGTFFTTKYLLIGGKKFRKKRPVINKLLKSKLFKSLLNIANKKILQIKEYYI